MKTIMTVAFAALLMAQSRSNPVVDQMLQALGGPAFLDVREIHTSGRFFSFAKGELSGSDLFDDYIKFPDMERTEFGPERRRSITINHGKEGWKIEPKSKEAEPQPIGQADDFLVNFKTSFDYLTRFVLKQPQTTIQDLPSELIDFKRADVVEIRDLSKNLIRLYIDRSTHLPMKMQIRRANQSEVNEELYGNWHQFQGVMTPLFVSRSSNGRKTMEIHAETAAYNPGLSDNLFSVPAAK